MTAAKRLIRGIKIFEKVGEKSMPATDQGLTGPVHFCGRWYTSEALRHCSTIYENVRSEMLKAAWVLLFKITIVHNEYATQVYFSSR